MTKDYDLIIAGGGLVGASLLLALKKSGLKIALIEAKEHSARLTQALDQRSLVLSLASKLFYEQLGIWPVLAKQTTKINKITISEQGKFNKVFLNKLSLGVDALGYVINIPLLNQSIWHAINLVSDQNIEIFCPAMVRSLTENEDRVLVKLEQEHTTSSISGKILIAADGGRSFIRDLLNIPNQAHNYQQSALIANVRHEIKNNNTAYERFSEQGPFALLPGLDPHISGIVWPWPNTKIDYVKNLSDIDLLQKLQELFGYKLGRFVKIGERQWFGLWRILSQELSKGRVLLLGNAANNLHPVGGQGFNLGLRDVKYLSKILSDNLSQLLKNNLPQIQIDLLFNEYKKNRIDDHYNLRHGTHGLLDLFTNQSTSVQLLRSMGMTVMNHSLILRSFIADRSMGLNS